jgi:hypothetical protein
MKRGASGPLTRRPAVQVDALYAAITGGTSLLPGLGAAHPPLEDLALVAV